MSCTALLLTLALFGAGQGLGPKKVPARAQVIDLRTQEPLPGALIQVYRFEGTEEQRSLQEQRTTDENGVFTTLGNFPRGVLYARVVDTPDVELGRVLWAHDPRDPRDKDPTQLSVAVGPTYRLSIETSETTELSDWRARIVERHDSGARRVWAWIHVREGDPPYLRYPRAEHPPSDEWHPRLELISRGFRWRGETEVGSTEGVHAATIAMVPRRLGAVSGVATDADRAPLSDARLTLIPTAIEALETPDLWPRASTDSEGRFRFEGIDPATYRLRAERPGAIAHAIEVPPGDTALGEWIAAPAPGTFVEGEIGASPAAVLLSLRPASADGTPVRNASLHYQLVGSELTPRRPSPFRFEAIPDGDYELFARSLDGVTALHPPILPVSSPASDLQLSCVRPAQRLPLILHARDAASGERLPEFLVQLRSDRGWTPDPLIATDGELRVDLPVDLEFEFSVHTLDHRVVRRKMRATPETLSEPIEVTLLPGFGARFFVRDGSGLYDPDDWAASIAATSDHKPLAGVEVVIGSFVVGITDGDGIVELDLDEAPARLEFLRDAWHVFPSPFFRGGRVRGSGREVVIWMHPDD